MKPAPHAHQVRLRNISSGLVRLAWPVDAREMLKTGGWEVVGTDAPLGPPSNPPAPADPPATPTHRESLEARSYKDLQVLAKRAGLNAGQKKEDLIAAILPLVAARTVSLEDVPAMAPEPVAFPVTVE